MEHPNTVSGLASKRDELVKDREQLEAEVTRLTVDIDHLDAAIRIFDPKEAQAARKRFAATNKKPRYQITRFLLRKLRESPEPLNLRQLAAMWCEERSVAPTSTTLAWVRERIGNTLRTLKRKGVVRQEGRTEGLIGWRPTRSAG